MNIFKEKNLFKEKNVLKEKVIFTPEVFVAGVIDYNKGNDWEIAWNNASNTLDDEDILLNISKHNGKIYYLAAHSRDFSIVSSPNTDIVSPLSCALPGNPNHKGDGIYLYEILSGFAVIVCKDEGETLLSYLAKDDQLSDLERIHGLPVYDNLIGDNIWTGYNRYTIKKTFLYSLYSLLGLSFLSIALILTNVFLMIENSNLKSNNEELKQNIEQKISSFKNSVVKDINGQHTILTEFQLLHKITKSAMEYEATIKKYSYNKKDNRYIYEIEYPYYVTSNVYSFLPNPKVSFDDNKNVIVVKSEFDR